MNKSKKVVAIIGATGQIGNHLVSELLDSNQVETIHIISRKEMDIQSPKVVYHITSLDQLLKIDLPKIDIGYCCLGTTLKLARSIKQFRKVDIDYVHHFAKRLKKTGTQAFNVVSAIGADSYSSNYYKEAKGEMEEHLMKLDFKSLSIFRPSLLLASRSEKRTLEEFVMPISKVLNIFLVRSLSKYQSIPVSVVATAMYKYSLLELKGVKFYYKKEMDAIA